MRTCRHCNSSLPLEDFRLQVRRDYPDGYRGYICYKCEKARQNSRANTPQWKKAKREYHLKARYGLDDAAVLNMRRAQNDQCLICGRRLGLRPHVDHNHDTGKVRGLLCAPCNMYLGHTKENPAVFQSAIAYLARHANS